jgi:hypothetical protein
MIFKTLWNETHQYFVHFDLSPITDEVIWMNGSLPMVFAPTAEMETIQMYLGDSVFPEGTELKTVQMQFI